MEPDIWRKFAQFVKSSFQEKFKAFMPGVFMGFIGGQRLLWTGLPISVVEYIIKFLGTVTLAFGSGLATSFAAYLVDNYKKKKNVKGQQKKSQKGKAA